MFQKIELRKIRDFGAKLNVTFEFIRQNFRILAKSVVYISGAFTLLGGIFMGLYQREALSLGGGNSALFALQNFGTMALWYLIGVFFLALAYVSTSLVVNEFVRLYEISPDPQTIEISDVWEGVKENFAAMFFAGVAVTIITCFALLLLFFPAIYVGVAFSLIGPIIVMEKKSIGEALSRCFSLINEKWWSTFGLLFVCSLIAGMMAFIFQVPQTVFALLMVFHKTSDHLAEPPVWEQIGVLVSTIISTVGSNFLQTIVFTALIFQYFNLVERKEATGLMNKLESFGKAEEEKPIQHDETY